MDLKRLPPSLLIALGLAACESDGDGATVGACLNVDPTVTTGSSSGTSSGSGTTEVGPCLDVDPSITTGGTTVGPCLDVPPGTTSTGADTDTDTDTDTDGDTDTSTGGDAGAGAPSESSHRSAVLGRLLDAGILPSDVAARLSGEADD